METRAIKLSVCSVWAGVKVRGCVEHLVRLWQHLEIWPTYFKKQRKTDL